MNTHIIVGQAAAAKLQEAVQLEEQLQGEILVLTDYYHLGPLYHTDNAISFEQLRKDYWQSLGKTFAEDTISDAELVNNCIAKYTQSHTHEAMESEGAEKENTVEGKIIFWMAPNANDVCAYYWLASLCKAHTGLLHVIAIDSLPFFNEKGVLFYPKSFKEILPSELVKCKHLIRAISPADFELDIDEWIRISEENGIVRSHDVGKKISTRNETHFDGAIYLSVTSNFLKASKVLQSCMNKGGAQANEWFMANRLSTLVAQGNFAVQGDTSKALKDFEIKSNKQEAVEEATAEDA